MSYGKPTDFDFGFNVHDYAPDAKRGRNDFQHQPCWNNQSPVHVIEHEGPLTIDWLVSEVKERIKAITNFVKTEGTLITYNDAPDSKRGGKSKNTSTLPTLKPENLTFEKRSLKVLAARKVDGNYGEQVCLKVNYAGQLWLWWQSIKKNNSILTFLINNFSQDETTWAGSEFLIYLEQDEFDLRNYTRVEKLNKATRK